LSTLQSSTVGSIEPSMKQSRKDYLKNWRITNSDKVRKHKQDYYWNHLEQERARACKIYQKNKGSTTSGKIIDRICNKNKGTGLELSSTQFFRINFILDKGSEQINELCKSEKISTWKAYNIVRQELDRFTLEFVMYMRNQDMQSPGIEKEIAKIKSKYPNLKSMEVEE